MEKKRVGLDIELTEKGFYAHKPLYHAKLRLSEEALEQQRREKQRQEEERLVQEREARYRVSSYVWRRKPELPLRDPEVLSTNYLDGKPVVRVRTDNRVTPTVSFTLNGFQQEIEQTRQVEDDVYEYVLRPMIDVLANQEGSNTVELPEEFRELA